MRRVIASVPLLFSLLFLATLSSSASVAASASVVTTTAAGAAGASAASSCGAIGSCSSSIEEEVQILTSRGGGNNEEEEETPPPAATDKDGTNRSEEETTTTTTTTTLPDNNNQEKEVEKEEKEEEKSKEEEKEEKKEEEVEAIETTETTNNETKLDTLNNNNNTTNLSFPLTKEGDGSSTDPDGIPTRYLLMQKHHRPHALTAYQNTLAFRKTHSVDTILSRPHAKYNQVKRVFPHYFAGRDIKGNPILVQHLGQIDLTVAKELHVTKDEIVLHYVYILEYCWNILESSPKGVMTSILDLDGVSWRELKDPEKMAFVKRVVKTISAHYPQRSYKTLILNAPMWFYGVYNLIKPLLRESTKAKIEILKRGLKQDEVLKEFLGEEGVPKQLLVQQEEEEQQRQEEEGASGGLYVSAKTEPGPNSEIEQEIRAFVMDILKKHNVEMLPC